MAGRTTARRLTLIALVVLATPVAWAGGLTVASAPLGAGADDGVPCDTDGVTLAYVIEGSSIKGVTVSGIATACTGGEVRVTVRRNPTAAIAQGAGTQPITTTSATVVLDAKPALTDSAFVGVVVVGP